MENTIKEGLLLAAQRFRESIERHNPDEAVKYLQIIKELRGFGGSEPDPEPVENHNSAVEAVIEDIAEEYQGSEWLSIRDAADAFGQDLREVRHWVDKELVTSRPKKGDKRGTREVSVRSVAEFISGN